VPDAKVLGIDADLNATLRGSTAGVTVPFLALRIDPSTYDDLARCMREAEIDTVMARRCLPELLGDVMWSVGDFANALREGGARDVFLQGRVRVPRPINPLHCVEREAAALGPVFKTKELLGDLAHMVAP
jgi:hypothetical protein